MYEVVEHASFEVLYEDAVAIADTVGGAWEFHSFVDDETQDRAMVFLAEYYGKEVY